MHWAIFLVIGRCSECRLDQPRAIQVDVCLEHCSAQAAYRVQDCLQVLGRVNDEQDRRPWPHQVLEVPNEIVADGIYRLVATRENIDCRT